MHDDFANHNDFNALLFEYQASLHIRTEKAQNENSYFLPIF